MNEKNFILEVVRLCKKHGFSISYDARYDVFLLDNFNENDTNRLLCIKKEDILKTHEKDYRVFTDEEEELAKQLFFPRKKPILKSTEQASNENI